MSPTVQDARRYALDDARGRLRRVGLDDGAVPRVSFVLRKGRIVGCAVTFCLEGWGHVETLVEVIAAGEGYGEVEEFVDGGEKTGVTFSYQL